MQGAGNVEFWLGAALSASRADRPQRDRQPNPNGVDSPSETRSVEEQVKVVAAPRNQPCHAPVYPSRGGGWCAPRLADIGELAVETVQRLDDDHVEAAPSAFTCMCWNADRRRLAPLWAGSAQTTTISQ